MMVGARGTVLEVTPLDSYEGGTRTIEHRVFPRAISCLELVDPTVGTDWSISRVHDRWLIGYPRMLDEAFHIGLERGEDPRFQEMYAQLLRSAQVTP